MSKKSPSNDHEALKGSIQSKRKNNNVSSSYQNSSKSTTCELTEKDLLKKLKEGISITPEDIMKLKKPTQSNF